MEASRDLEARLRQAVRFFYALKDPVRLRILLALARAGEMTVTEIVQAVRLAQPLVSWHLARLRAAALVQVTRDGRLARYTLDRNALERQWADFLALLQEASR
ncbi:MAG: metalloregulator ArsR/SmtB family transcription factor [Anaerolineae bacterium]|nr:metalloregulator ArsR/SmtB family transcription factor [Anaerolineae bacterium]MDW8067929.1 metalloregulator ArsR/SmtB family transcription factor [Anaerolineae bacterium]